MTPWVSLETHGARAVRVIRHDVPFDTLEDVVTAYGGAADALERMDRARMGVVVDLRSAPSRNDPAFEATVAPLRKRLFTDFARRAVLVRSAVGKLQVKRHAAQDGIDVEVFHDLDEAVAWISTP
ncbi:MAG: hypothetical protein RLO52_14190 [Sandaracinaceae bacterium]